MEYLNLLNNDHQSDMCLDDGNQNNLLNIAPDEEPSEFCKIILSWGIPIEITKHIEGFGFNVESLQYMRNRDFNDIFSRSQFGHKIKFREKLFEWRGLNGYVIDLDQELINTAVSDGSNSHFDDFIFNNTLKEAPPLTTNTLEDLLQNTSKGKWILNFDRDKPLNKIHQSDWASCIVSSFLTIHHRGLKVEEIEGFAKKIIDLFPKEQIETYFIPRYKGKNPRGKLYDKNVNILQNYRKRGYILKKTNSVIKDTPCNKENLENIFPIEENSTEKCTWLKNNLQPWGRVEEYWEDTYNLRRKNVLQENSTQNILKAWPRYKDSTGYLLVEIDFEKLYKNNTNGLYKRWTDFCTNIFKLYQNNIKDSNSAKLLSICLKDDTSEESKNCIAVMLLFSILKSPRISLKKKPKKFWKPSITEAQESLVILINSINNLEKAIEDRTEKYFSFGLQIQPFIIVVGENINKITDYYVIYDDIKYKIQSFLTALDITFKLYHALNFEYPVAGKLVFSFIQKYFYEIVSDADIFNCDVNNLIQMLNQKPP